MDIEQSAYNNEKTNEEIVKENEKTNERKRERNREHQRAWRQRQNFFKIKVSKAEKEEKKRKRLRENCRAYYYRKKALKKNDKNVEELSQRKLDNLQIKRKKLDSNEDQENIVQCSASQNLEKVQLEQNQFLTQQIHLYGESHECITPKVILHRHTNIPSDANCLFHSLICVLQLDILTCDLKRQLRDSPYLNSCQNPQETYDILSSNNGYGGLDCVYLFAKHYNKNICVHNHYFNYFKVISKNEDTRFYHFKANDTCNWIHLDLRGLYFTPYLSDDEKKKEDERKRKQKNKEVSKQYRDKKRALKFQRLYFTPYLSDDEKKEEDERKRKQKNKEAVKRYRDKKRALKFQPGPSARDVQPVILNSQIAEKPKKFIKRTAAIPSIFPRSKPRQPSPEKFSFDQSNVKATYFHPKPTNFIEIVPIKTENPLEYSEHLTNMNVQLQPTSSIEIKNENDYMSTRSIEIKKENDYLSDDLDIDENFVPECLEIKLEPEVIG